MKMREKGTSDQSLYFLPSLQFVSWNNVGENHNMQVNEQRKQPHIIMHQLCRPLASTSVLKEEHPGSDRQACNPDTHIDSDPS